MLNNIENGYNRAITNEMITIQTNFLNGLASGRQLITDQDSCFAFLNEMLFQARKQDLDAMKN